MHFGVLSVFQNYRDEQDDTDIMRAELELACLADRAGYDSYWATEHHFFGYSMCPDNLQWLAQVGGMTERIKLGTGAVIMPWNDPYRVAAKVALLDQQTGGRALLGFGRGLSRREYEGFAEREPPPRVTTRGLVYARPFGTAAEPAAGPAGLELEGVGCSPGRARGRARIVRDPIDRPRTFRARVERRPPTRSQATGVGRAVEWGRVRDATHHSVKTSGRSGRSTRG